MKSCSISTFYLGVLFPLHIMVVNSYSSSLFSNHFSSLRSSSQDYLTKEWEWPQKIVDIRPLLATNITFVPVIGKQTDQETFWRKRVEMFDDGIYPGVEYRVLAMSGEQQYANVTMSVRPVYPLISQLERDWPVDVKMADIPRIYSRGMYNTLAVTASTFLAGVTLFSTILLSQIFTFSFVNSRSMEPTIQPRDLILVEKVSPFLLRNVLKVSPAREGEVVFFKAPPALQDYARTAQALRETRSPQGPLGPSASSGGIGANTLVVKRVVSLNGDGDGDGRQRGVSGLSALPAEGSSWCLEVRGDNPAVSVDSRQWGCLPAELVVGKPLLRVLPLERFGSLSPNHATGTTSPSSPPSSVAGGGAARPVP